MRVANPGILVGLNPDLGFEMLALALHARHLRARGMEVYLSVPRLRQIAGSHDQRGADDAAFVRLVSLLSLALPTCKIVLTTREPAAMQRTLVPIVTVLSAGSAAVAPYTESGARFPLETSQFEVIDQRPFEEILRRMARAGRHREFRTDGSGRPRRACPPGHQRRRAVTRPAGRRIVPPSRPAARSPLRPAQRNRGPCASAR